MDYSRLLNRAWEIIWRHPFLILMGMLAALSGGIGGGGGNNANFRFGDNGQPPQAPNIGPIQLPDFGDLGGMAGLGIAAGLMLLCFALIIGIAFWLIGTIARGGLIASVETIETGGNSSFGASWRAGLNRAGVLIGISLIPAIPVLILFLSAVSAWGAYGGMTGVFGEAASPFGAGLFSILGLLGCIAVPFAFILGLLRTFAERACMLEGLGVVDSYRRGFDVLSANIGAAIVLFLIQIAISIVIGIALFVPGLIMAICFLFWPVLWLINGAIAAYFSTLWTLAWRVWTAAPAAPAEGTI